MIKYQRVFGAATQSEGGGGVPVRASHSPDPMGYAAAGYPAVQGHRLQICWHGGDACGRPPELLLLGDEHSTA